MTTNEKPNEIVIVGGGLAAQRCAETLRREGHAGTIRMVCAEPHLPYDRPPLSKQLLTGGRAADSLGFRPPEWYAEQRIDLLLGVAATGLRTQDHRLLLAGDAELPYDRLLIATGSRPRMLPTLAGARNVSVLRTLDDSLALRQALTERGELVVIGAGFIGQEVAATARRLGATVTMIEAAEAPLVGILGPRLGAWFARLHREEGVELLTGCTVERAEANGTVSALHLSNGRRVPAGHVLVGVGVAAEAQWLADTGLANRDGIPVDSWGRTSAPDVFAAGDVAATFDPVAGRHRGGAHWEAAARQGARAARAMLGGDPGPPVTSSFWSDQYGIRIQYLGNAQGADAVDVDGDPDARDFTATFSRAGRPVAALLVNRPRQLPAARALIEKGMT